MAVAVALCVVGLAICLVRLDSSSVPAGPSDGIGAPVRFAVTPVGHGEETEAEG
jgi:hypothetical protein